MIGKHVFGRTILGFLAVLFAGIAGNSIESKGAPTEWSVLIPAALLCLGAIVWSLRLGDGSRRGIVARAATLAALCFVSFVIVIIITPVMRSAKVASAMTKCIIGCKSLGTSLMMYSGDYEEVLPPASIWRSCTAYLRHSNEDIACPLAKSPFSFALNSNLRRLSDVEKPETTPLVFEANAQQENATGSSSMFETRHGSRGNSCTVDGSSKPTGATQLTWGP